MRQRSTGAGNSGIIRAANSSGRNPLFPPSVQLPSRPDNDNSSSDDDDSDPEATIQASQPDEDAFTSRSNTPWLTPDQHRHPPAIVSQNFRQILQEFFHSNKTWWSQGLTITLAAISTYSYNNSNNGNSDNNSTNVQIAIMTVITLVGASPFWQTHLTTAAIGAFVGGHNIIGATGLDSATPNDTPPNLVSYLWLLVLATAVTTVWCRGMVPWRILDGYAGRLGTTTFCGMNLVQLLVWGPARVVDWNRYYFGFVHLVHVAEEADSTATSLASAWKWTEEFELALGYVLAVVWLAVVAGATRILHQQHVERWQGLQQDNNNNQQQQQSSTPPPKPLNNILIPVLWALLSMLLVHMTQYRHAPGLYNGFAVGSYVAMASLQKISTIREFAMVGLVAAGWGLTLTPFFVGFAGKAGFTAMLGHVTYATFLQPIVDKWFYSWASQQSQQHQRQQVPQQVPGLQLSTLSRRDEPLPVLQPQPEPHQQPAVVPSTTPQQPQPHEQSSSHQQQHHPEPPQSPVRERVVKPKKSQVFHSKQQRRQQQRLQHLQQQQQQQQQQQERPEQWQTTQQQQHQQQPQQQPLLHHRAWSATADATEAAWHHPAERL